ncbi:hypothetical protein RsoM2USA_24 [Ralstonia phage RsoM2USA]|nr:hypothetical protein RsoM2USA_24 [Ralstonia phage RsoM2USA]
MTAFINTNDLTIVSEAAENVLAVNEAIDLQPISTNDLVALYNKFADAPVKKFSDRETAMNRVFKVIQMNTNVEHTQTSADANLHSGAELNDGDTLEQEAAKIQPSAFSWMAQEADIAAKAADIAGIKSKTKTTRKRVVKQTESTLDKIKAFIETGAEFTLKSLAEQFEIKESTAGVFVSTLKSKNGAHAMPIVIDKKSKTYKLAPKADAVEAPAAESTEQTEA